MTPTLAAGPAQLIFDLAALKFITSAGIRLFFMATKAQKKHGGQALFVMGMPNVYIFANNAELDADLVGRQRSDGEERAR